ncbi:MAG: metalloregulator ArsR/SmtB family transcription factor, partial [Eubacterium sp.]
MITDILKTLSDPTRLRILNLLSHGEMCVCELEYLLGIKQSNLSKHLGILDRNHLIRRNRVNKFVFCQI